MLDHPYLTVDEFRATPTYLDSNNLRSGGTQEQQDAALFNALLEASEWADEWLNMPLRAHVRSENVRTRADRRGQLRYHPEHAPVIEVTGVATGADPTQLEALNDPQTWTELDGRIVVMASPSGGPGLNMLQFGSPVGVDEMLIHWSYIAGYPATQLVEDVDAAATTVTVLDATGVAAGTVLRLWTPGAEEAVTVIAVAGDVLTLSGGLRHAHTTGDTISAVPATARRAVINYATAILMRPAPQAQENLLQTTGVRAPSLSAAARDPRRTTGGAALVAEAERLLSTFARIR